MNQYQCPADTDSATVFNHKFQNYFLHLYTIIYDPTNLKIFNSLQSISKIFILNLAISKWPTNKNNQTYKSTSQSGTFSFSNKKNY